MDNAKPIESSGAFGIPKWIMKKGMRYEVDDFIVSPPSNEDGGFMRLRYGRSPSPRRHLSPLDGAEAERGMTVEVRESSSVISGVRGSDSQDSLGLAQTISFGPGIFSAETTPVTTPLTPSGSVFEPPHAAPPSLLPASSLLDTIPTTKDKTCLDSESSISPPVESSQPPQPSTRSTSDVIVKAFRKISSPTRPSFEGLLYEGELQESSQSFSEGTTPTNTPVPTPKSSPQLQRKVMGIAMEHPDRKISAHSYFCTKPFQPQQQDISQLQDDQQQSWKKMTVQSYFSTKKYQEKLQDPNASASEGNGGTSTLSYTAAARTQQLDEGAKSLESLDISGKYMGKRRQRPKPSALREMNFWAPTSM